MLIRKRGFTLVELIVVIAIIAILASIVSVSAFRAIEKSKIAKTQAELKTLKTAIAALYADTSKFPNGCPAFTVANPEVYLDGAQAGLVKKPTVGVVESPCEWTQIAVDAWDGPYIDKNTARDFWQTSYFFDPDYAQCTTGSSMTSVDISTCSSSSSLVSECRAMCGGSLNCAPPVIMSFGPDKQEYTCDDIVVNMTLNY